MFNQYGFIEEVHRSALERVVRSHSVLTPPHAARLYSLALDALTGTRVPRETGFVVSRIDGNEAAVGTCTDQKTGLFVQLASRKGSKQVMLTVGTRWAMESSDVGTGTTNIIVW